MRDYELVVVISPEGGDENFAVVVERITIAIKDNGGEIQDVDEWGKRRLAYPIRRYLDGYYAVFHFGGEPSAIRPLEAGLDFADDVLRHLVVRLDEPAPAPSEPPEPAVAATAASAEEE